jgi:hypothetical protein
MTDFAPHILSGDEFDTRYSTCEGGFPPFYFFRHFGPQSLARMV